MTGKMPTLRLFCTALMVSLGTSFHFGFQVSVTNPSEAIFMSFLNRTMVTHYDLKPDMDLLQYYWHTIVSLFFVGGIIGSLSVHRVADTFGRKGGLMFTLVLHAVGLSMIIIGKSIDRFEFFAAARLLLGFSTTISICIAGIYLAECSPKYCRGGVSMMIGVMLQIGVLCGAASGMPSTLGTTSRFWIIDASELVISLLVIVALLRAHESPSYLLKHNNEVKARQVVQYFHNSEKAGSCQLATDETLNELHEELKIYAESLGMLDLCRSGSKYDRRGAIIGCVIGLSVIFSGVSVLMAYSVIMLKQMGFEPNTASMINVLIMAASAAGCIVSTTLVDRFGRRHILLITYAILVVLQIVIALLIYEPFRNELSGYLLAIVFGIFVIIFAIGPGPISVFIISELLSQNAQSAGQSWSFFLQMSSRSIILIIFSPLQKVVGESYAFLMLFVAPIIATIILVYFRLPETKNRNVREVQNEFNKLPKFKFFGLGHDKKNATI